MVREWKRFLSAILCAVLLLAMLPQVQLRVAAEATEGTCGKNVSWSLENGTLTISGNGQMDCYGYDGWAPWREYGSLITNVVVQHGVTGIGSYAFSGCNNLTSIVIPASVTRIYFFAFDNCRNLTSVTFLGSAPTLDRDCFWSVGATIYYPCGDETWTNDVMEKDYCGGLTWKEHHSFGDNTIQDATCDQDASITKTCFDCGITETSTVPGSATGHSYTNGICIHCNEECTHQFDSGAWLYVVTCTQKGEKVYFCNLCGEQKHEFFPAAGHDFQNGQCTRCYTYCTHNYQDGRCIICGKACEHNYLTIPYRCSICGQRCPHELTAYIGEIYGICGQTGSVDTICSACGWLGYEVISVVPHKFENDVCIRCGAEENKDYTIVLLDDGTCRITSCLLTDTTLIIPETINNFPVSVIGDNAFYQANFAHVTLPPSVKTIGENAFAASAMTTLVLTGDAPEIGSNALNTLSTVTVKYPAGNETYTEVLMSSFSNVIWERYCLKHNYVGGKCEYCGETDPNCASLTGTMMLTCENVKIYLFVSGEDSPTYTAFTDGERYRFEGVVPGEYILKVLCEGGVPRDYPVTLAIGENVQDVVLLRPGDVNGDRAVNIGDVTMIYAHIRGTAALEGYSLQCADLNGDGEVNIVDVAMAYRQSKI